MTTTIYRQADAFPPDPSSYVSLFERRRQAGKKPYPRPQLDRASRGLSVFTDLDAMRRHARENTRLGTLIVRYHLPDTVAFELEHLVGDLSHHTLTMDDPGALADFLDTTWWEIQE